MKIIKKLSTRQVEDQKRRLGKKWVSWWTENPKGRSRQKLGIKSVRLCPAICLPEEGLSANNYQHPTRNRGNKGWSEQSDCSILQGIKVGPVEEHNQYSSIPPQESPTQLPQEGWNLSPQAISVSPSRFWKLIP